MNSDLISLVLLAIAMAIFAGVLWILMRVQELRERNRKLKLENDRLERQSP